MTRIANKMFGKTSLNSVGMGVKRKSLHVVRTACNKCGLTFEDKYYDEEYSNNDAGRKKSEGTHLVECPYCGHINAKQYSHWDQIKEQGQYRDYAEDCYYGTRFGPAPPLPKHMQLEKNQVHKVAEKETSLFHKLLKRF